MRRRVSRQSAFASLRAQSASSANADPAASAEQDTSEFLSAPGSQLSDKIGGRGVGSLHRLSAGGNSETQLCAVHFLMVLVYHRECNTKRVQVAIHVDHRLGEVGAEDPDFAYDLVEESVHRLLKR